LSETRTAGAWAATPKGITWISGMVNVTLAVAKILVGIACRSQTLLADGLHSASDLVTDVAVLAGLRVSSRPADLSHPYGHRRFSTLVGMFIGVTLLAAAVWVAYSALSTFHNYLHKHIRIAIRPGLPFWLALASVPVKEAMFRISRWVGRRASDVSVIANAWHHRTDAFTSAAATVGLAGVLFGGNSWQFLDPLTAIVLAAFLVVASVRITVTSASELVDRAPDREILERIGQVVAKTQGVVSYHALRARQVGGQITMDIHIQVDPNLTVQQGHEIASVVRQRIMEAPCEVVEVVVHIEPAEG